MASNPYTSTIAKKFAMAVTGLALVGFVLGHLLGNLKIYQGAAKYDAYAQGLREFGAPILGHEQFLWIARIGLLACVFIHIVAAAQLTRRSRAARPTGYERRHDLSFSYASRTMRWGGVILLSFIIYHLLHLTTGTAHPTFDHESVYGNVVRGFSAWPVASFYILCMIPLTFHLYHGIWSVTQTLALDAPPILRWRRPVAAAVSSIVFFGNISIPISVLAGWVS